MDDEIIANSAICARRERRLQRSEFRSNMYLHVEFILFRVNV